MRGHIEGFGNERCCGLRLWYSNGGEQNWLFSGVILEVDLTGFMMSGVSGEAISKVIPGFLTWTTEWRMMLLLRCSTLVIEQIRRKHHMIWSCIMWHSREDVKDSWCVNLEINKEVRDRDVNLDVVIMYNVFKTVEMSKITWGLYLYREKKGTYEEIWGNLTSKSWYLSLIKRITSIYKYLVREQRRSDTLLCSLSVCSKPNWGGGVGWSRSKRRREEGKRETETEKVLKL